jgi:hypothetical protein
VTTTTTDTEQSTDSTQDFGSNTENQASMSATEGDAELTFEQKVQAIVDKMGTNIGTNPLREEYMETVRSLTQEAEVLSSEGKSKEQIARTLHQRRIDIGKEYKGLTPGPLKEFILEVNMDRYGNEYGPSIETLLKKYDGDWDTIIEKSATPNENIDGLLAGFKGWLMKKNPAYIDAAHAEWG